MKNGADTIKAAMMAMGSVKKMDIDPESGRVLRRENKSILEDVYEKSGAVIPVEVQKIVEDKKESLEKTLNPTKNIVSSYYSMIQGKTQEEVLVEEKKREEIIERVTPSKSLPTKTPTISKLPNEDAYMASLVNAINKKR